MAWPVRGAWRVRDQPGARLGAAGAQQGSGQFCQGRDGLPHRGGQGGLSGGRPAGCRIGEPQCDLAEILHQLRPVRGRARQPGAACAVGSGVPTLSRIRLSIPLPRRVSTRLRLRGTWSVRHAVAGTAPGRCVGSGWWV